MKNKLPTLLALHLGLAAVVAQPVITCQPTNQTAIAGSTVTFTVCATGSPPLGYQWRSHANATTFTNIPWGTESMLVLTNIQPTTRRFAVVVTDGAGLSVTSSPLVALTVVSPPSITTEPWNQNTVAGESATLGVVATGTAPLAFRWSFNGQPRSGATSSNLVFPSIQFSNAGAYQVVVTNLYAAITSRVATVTVVPPTTFTPITNDPVVTDTDSFWNGSWGDYDNDGYIDLFVGGSGSGHDNHLYRNNGNGRFTRITTGPVVTDGRISIESHGSSWTDYDNDGFLDLFVTCSDVPLQRVDYNKLYHNNGNGTFTRITNGVIVTELGNSHGCSWADYDRDGFVDLFVVHHVGKNRLFHNNGNGGFDQIIVNDDENFSESCTWADYDNDGYPDLFITNVEGPNFLYHNDGGGRLTKITSGRIATEVTYSFGCAWGDYDNDGYQDLFVCSGDVGVHISRPSYLFHNNGDGTFSKITNGIVAADFTSGGFASSCAWVDYDNDGFLDLFVTQNSSSQYVKSFLYRNNGDGTFSRITQGRLVNDLGHSVGCPWGDINNDGFADVLVTRGYGGPANSTNSLYLNSGNSNAWLTLKLVGTASNRVAIGAKVRVRAFYRGAIRWQLREVSGGSGQASFNDLRAAFGLGEATSADLVRIEWPSGTVQELHDVAARQILTITEPPRLHATGLQPDGSLQLLLTGASGLRYELQTSSNLVAWNAWQTVTNTSRSIGITDSNAAGLTQRFYRAVGP